MYCAGYDAFKAQTQRAGGSRTPGGHSLLVDAVEKVSAGIVSWLRDCQRSGKRGRQSEAYAALAPIVGADEIAFIALRTMLDTALAGATGKVADEGLYHWPTAQAMYENIGREIELYAKLKAFESEHGRLRARSGPTWKIKYRYAQAMKREGFVWQAWTTRRIIHVGARCYVIIEHSTGLVRRVQRGKKAHFLKECRLTDDALKTLSDKNELRALRAARRLPMVYLPNRWSDTEDGGYLCKEWLPFRIIRHGHKDQFVGVSSTTCPEVFAALNHIQTTPWRINKRVLDFALSLEKRGQFPLPKDLWKQNPEGQRSLTAQAYTVLREAERFADEERFWLPVNMDFRGRIYYGSSLSPQGSKLARALLEFADPVPITKERYPDCTTSVPVAAFTRYGLKLHGFKWKDEFRLMGPGSLPVGKMERYASELRCLALDACVRHPLRDLSWCSAKEPWLWLAWCFAQVDCIDEGLPEFIVDSPSRFPVYVDATASGMQHLSALLRDEQLAELVNIVDPYDREPPASYWDTMMERGPKDLYAVVAENLDDRLCRKLDADDGDGEMARWWLTFGLDRGLVKSPTMTLLYGSTPHGRTRQIKGELPRRNKTKPVIDDVKAADWLEKQLSTVNRDIAPLPAAFMDKLRTTARGLAQKGKHLEWTAPSGFPVRQREFQMKKPRWSVPGMTVTIHEPTGIVSAKDAANGAVANFVHSLDAAHLVKAVNAAAAAGVQHVGVVHDCFAVHAGNVPTLQACAVKTFAEMHSQDLLEECRQRWSLIVEGGKLDVARLKDARYLVI